ncbi:MAG: hypothetical protein M3Q29_02220 [Chloroflexota bacterium]|nr:hypothetical protein [Chloroflexota bacterium]
MMGSKQRAFGPLVSVSLEDLVPNDHFYRHLDAKLDLSFVRERFCCRGVGSTMTSQWYQRQELVLGMFAVRERGDTERRKDTAREPEVALQRVSAEVHYSLQQLLLTPPLPR